MNGKQLLPIHHSHELHQLISLVHSRFLPYRRPTLKRRTLLIPPLILPMPPHSIPPLLPPMAMTPPFEIVLTVTIDVSISPSPRFLLTLVICIPMPMPGLPTPPPRVYIS
jgi:hypothetical protein